MATSMFQPAIELVGDELSTLTRILEATKNAPNKGVDPEEHKEAFAAYEALLKKAPVPVDGLNSLTGIIDAYVKSLDDRPTYMSSNVSKDEAFKLKEWIEGLIDQSEEEDNKKKSDQMPKTAKTSAKAQNQRDADAAQKQ